VSLSKSPSFPTPLVLRYKAAGQPSPPQPIIRALLFFNLTWPFQKLVLYSLENEETRFV
jgi:hypothetical protein